MIFILAIPEIPAKYRRVAERERRERRRERTRERRSEIERKNAAVEKENGARPTRDDNDNEIIIVRRTAVHKE
jgi:hypothetical protein